MKDNIIRNTLHKTNVKRFRLIATLNNYDINVGTYSRYFLRSILEYDTSTISTTLIVVKYEIGQSIDYKYEHKNPSPIYFNIYLISLKVPYD